MMTRKNNFLLKRKILFVISLFFSCFQLVFASDNKSWVLAAEKFKFAKGQTSNAVIDATAETLPSRILEKIGQSLIRSVEPDERLERIMYDSKKERLSLFLQLSSEYKKRDSIVLNNYSERELKKKLSEKEKKLSEIQTKIDQNLQNLKEEEELSEKLYTKEQYERNLKDQNSDTELKKYSKLVKNFFTKGEEFFTFEDITFYGNDSQSLFKPTENASKLGYESSIFEKECINANINALLTGTITVYGDYLSVNVEVFTYPGGKKLLSVMEVSSINELDLLCTNIAHSIIPVIVNAMPVNVVFAVNQNEKKSEVFLYIDNQLQTSFDSEMKINSGVHTIQFSADGYKTVSTSYFFEGSKNYFVEVNLEEQKNGLIEIALKPSKIDLLYQKLPFHKEYSNEGTIYANGIQADNVENSANNSSQIVINGNKILGQFISEDGLTDFYYIPDKLIFDGSKVTINPKPLDRNTEIDTRRKWMYGTYSALITSLIPTFYCNGRFNSAKQKFMQSGILYSDSLISFNDYNKDYEEAKKWMTAQNICVGISIGCGVLFAIELIRYFTAANAVLPKKAFEAKFTNPIYNEQMFLQEIEKEDYINDEFTDNITENVVGE